MADETPPLPPDMDMAAWIDAARRNSGIRIDRDGVWWYRGAPMEHPRVIELFERGLRVDAAGDVELHVGDQWCYVDVDETAYFVRRARDAGGAREGGRVILVLSDHTEEPLDPRTVMAFGERDLYCRVKGGRCPARFLRDAYHHVIHRLEVGPDGGYAVRDGAARHPVRRLAAPPGALWTASAPEGGPR